jgi:hypothetical protein
MRRIAKKSVTKCMELLVIWPVQEFLALPANFIGTVPQIALSQSSYLLTQFS